MEADDWLVETRGEVTKISFILMLSSAQSNCLVTLNKK